jgi:hypothetical protein
MLTPVLALTSLRTFNVSLLDNKDTTVNTVDDNEARLKGVRRPSSSVPQRITTWLNIIRREKVKVRNLLDLAAVGITGNGGHVEDTETGLVVGLVVKTVVHVLIVVNRTRCVRACKRLAEAAKTPTTRDHVRGISGPSTLFNRQASRDSGCPKYMSQQNRP